MINIKIDNTTAQSLSELMYKITSPKNGTTTFLFAWGTDSDGVEYASIPDYNCKVYFEDLQTYLDEIKTLLNGDLTESDAERIGAAIRMGQITLTDLIPSTFETFTPNIIKQNPF